MYSLIERYINRMTKEDMNNFLVKKNIYLNDNELNYSYLFIKKNWNQILSSSNMIDLKRYKNNFSVENYSKIVNLYKEYFTKYHRMF